MLQLVEKWQSRCKNKKTEFRRKLKWAVEGLKQTVLMRRELHSFSMRKTETKKANMFQNLKLHKHQKSQSWMSWMSGTVWYVVEIAQEVWK